jgi:hypothetical protein
MAIGEVFASMALPANFVICSIADCGPGNFGVAGDPAMIRATRL